MRRNKRRAKPRVYSNAERRRLLGRLRGWYGDDGLCLDIIACHWGDDKFDEADYQELRGILRRFHPGRAR